MKYIVALVIALVLNASANLLMKLGMKTVQAGGGVLKDGPLGAVMAILTTPTLIIGLTCFGLNAAFYMYALQSDTLKISVAYPIMVGGGFALIATIARLHPALAEKLNTGQMVGIAMVLMGVIIIAIKTKAEGA